MTALDEALCWSCNICTFNNPLEIGQCAMCNNPRPQVQYENLLQIREEGRRQRILAEERARQLAMNSNTNSIKYQNLNETKNEEDDEEEAAKKLLDQDNGEEWNADDFEDDNDADWGDINIKEESDSWGDQTMDMNMDIKIPEKCQPYEILNPYKLHEYQISFLKEISEELYIKDLDYVGIMCRFYRWNRDELMNEYLQNSDKVFKKCGLISLSPNKKESIISKNKFNCWLCITEYNKAEMDTFSPECNHQYCNQCWTNYLVSNMEKGPRVVMTKCIEPKCKLTLRPSVFIKFLPYKYRTKFEEYILHSFVSGLNTLSWCPGKECINAIKADFGSIISINCPLCHYIWCFGCKKQAHLPCTCELADKWMKLHTSESENMTWVRAYTKECPKCNNHIEKNQGCNHMTCRCGYEFCWLCRKDWKKIGYGHQCNKPQDVIVEENEQKKAESYLKRYMFYFARYESHEKSAQIATKSILNAKECIRSFVINKGYYDTIKQFKYSDLQFIEDAILEVIQCRQILQWSYCYGYYLSDKCQLKILFETQQGLLESFSDQLHEKAEKKVDDKTQWFSLSDIKFRTELINLTKTAKKYRQNFCDALLSDNSLPFIFQRGLK